MKKQFVKPTVLQQLDVLLEEALLVDSGSEVTDVTITGQQREEVNNWSGETWTMD